MLSHTQARAHTYTPIPAQLSSSTASTNYADKYAQAFMLVQIQAQLYHAMPWRGQRKTFGRVDDLDFSFTFFRIACDDAGTQITKTQNFLIFFLVIFDGRDVGIERFTSTILCVQIAKNECIEPKIKAWLLLPLPGRSTANRMRLDAAK